MNKVRKAMVLVIGGAVLALAALQAWGETLYVADELRVSMRSDPGAGTYVGVAVTGDALSVLARQGDFVKVKANDGSVGWVLGKYLTADQPAMLQLPAMRDENRTLTQQINALRESMTEIQQDLKDAKEANATLAGRVREMSEKVDNYEGPQAEQARWWRWVGLGVALLAALAIGRWSGLRTYRRRVAERFGGLDV